MSYVKNTWDEKTWAKGQKHLQDALNHMETGIEEGGSGAGKTWHTLDLTAKQVEELSYGKRLVNIVDTPYDPANFKSDYITCNVNDTGISEGSTLWTGEDFNKIYVDLISEDLQNFIPYLVKITDEAIYRYGFDHNYYRTAVLWCGAASGQKSLKGDNVLEGQDVIYIQDVTQQDWEVNPEDTEKPVLLPADAREKLGHEIRNGAYVISIKGKDAANTKAFLLCIEDSQAAYYKSSVQDIRWANIEAGKVYPVHFDTTYDSLRWLLDDTETRSGKLYGKEMTTEVKQALAQTGLEMRADKFAVELLEDTAIGLKTYAVALRTNELRTLFSWNTPFIAPAGTHALEFIGRPTAYVNSTYYWTEDDGTTATFREEKVGYYIWTVNAQGAYISAIVPKTYPNRIILEVDQEAEYGYADLVRHTCTWTTTDEQRAQLGQNKYAVNISFTFDNAQYGESSLYYVLHSDFNQQQPNWIVAASGVVGKVTDLSGTVTTWNPVLRLVGSTKFVDDNAYPCLKITYFNTETKVVETAEVVDDSNFMDYTFTDFRSTISSVVTPAMLKADVAIAKE